jgi:threonine dehydrogenase-like Zn-dependent dehydrogenase
LLGPRDVQLQEFPLPAIGPDDGLLRVEIAGVCGADWAPYIGQRYDFFPIPLILGHEIVGRIARIGGQAADRWGVREGDRVVVEEPIPCGACAACRAGHYFGCPSHRYGATPTTVAPALWGGYSEYVYLDPRALVHRMDPSVPPEVAPLYVPVSNGLYWVQDVGRATPGSTVIILGPGQHGLGCVVGAREAGAERVIVVGLARDQQRLDVARTLGADHALVLEDERQLVDEVRQLSDGHGGDVLINTTERAPAALGLALELAAERATIVTVGTTHGAAAGLLPDLIWRKELTITGARGRSREAVRRAIRLIEAAQYRLGALATHVYPLAETEHALKTLGGEGDQRAIHISIVPAA